MSQITAAAKPEATVSTTKKLVFIAILGAVSFVLMMINISLPFAPAFLKFDIAELPALFAGFFMGPVAGFGVIVIKLLLKLIIQGTETAFGRRILQSGRVVGVRPHRGVYLQGEPHKKRRGHRHDRVLHYCQYSVHLH